MGGGAIDIMNLLYGTAFEQFASRGQLPPPGPAFLNRFCHKSFDDWADDYRDAMHDPSDNQLATSFDRLILALIELETKPTPAPVIYALEEAVCFHLAATLVASAGELLAARPELAGRIDTRLSPYWWVPHDRVRSWLAESMHRALSSLDDAAAESVRSAKTRPSGCVVFARIAIERYPSRLLSQDAELEAMLPTAANDRLMDELGKQKLGELTPDPQAALYQARKEWLQHVAATS